MSSHTVHAVCVRLCTECEVAAAAVGGDPNCEAAVADRPVLAPDGENEGPPGAALFEYYNNV